MISQTDFIEKNAKKLSDDIFMIVVDALQPIESQNPVNSMKKPLCSCLQKELNDLEKSIQNTVTNSIRNYE